MARLVDKVALITGAASGIGASIARAFVAEGAFVVLSDLQDGRGLNLRSALVPAQFIATSMSAESLIGQPSSTPFRRITASSISS